MVTRSGNNTPLDCLLGFSQRLAARLLGLATRLGGALTSEEVNNAIIEQARPALDADQSILLGLSDDGLRFQTLCRAGCGPIAGWGSFPLSLSTPIGDAVRSRRIILFETVENWPAYYLPAANFTSLSGAFVAIPLLLEDRAVGALCLGYCEPRLFDAEERAFMLSAAAQCALAMNRARLYDAERSANLLAAEQVWRSQENLRLAVDAARLGTFYCEWPFNKIVWNDTCKDHFFLPHDAEVDFGLFYSLLHPDDREPARLAIDRSMAEHSEYNVEYRTVAPDGHIRWVNAVGRGYYNGDGVPIRFDGVTSDITARKASEAAIASLLQRERHVAGTLQRSLLQVPPVGFFPGLDVASRYESATADLDIGGDFLDAFRLSGGKVALVVGDVSGKGLAAAAKTAEAKYSLRAFVREYAQPSTALTLLNAYLCESIDVDGTGDQDGFICLTLAIVDTLTGAITLSVAGTEPPLLIGAGGTRQIPAGGVPLCINPNYEYTDTHAQLLPGDLLVLVTDGITEARLGSSFYGYDGMVKQAEAAAGLASATDIASSILESAHAFAGGSLRDDACVLVARYQPATTST
ncbi:MAG: SpoIIE family protein phosphatase [Capsulimonadaceae bacterium]